MPAVTEVLNYPQRTLQVAAVDLKEEDLPTREEGADTEEVEVAEEADTGGEFSVGLLTYLNLMYRLAVAWLLRMVMMYSKYSLIP
mgnify:FL=1